MFSVLILPSLSLYFYLSVIREIWLIRIYEMPMNMNLYFAHQSQKHVILMFFTILMTPIHTYCFEWESTSNTFDDPTESIRKIQLNWIELFFLLPDHFILEGKTKNILQQQQSIKRIRSGYYDLSYNNAQFNFCRSFYKPRKGWWHGSLYANDNTSHHITL